MTDLTIRYDNGQMIIHIEGFLSCRNISKVRKLLKIINHSYTPEVTDQIQQYVTEKVGGIDGLVKISDDQVEKFTEEVKQAEYNVAVFKSQRDRNTRNSSPYKYYNEKLKAAKEELSEKKYSLSDAKREFNNRVRDKVFLEKLLSEVFS